MHLHVELFRAACSN